MIDRKDNSKLLRKRSFVLGGLKTLFTLIVFGKLYHLQILDKLKYGKLSDLNRIKVKILYPERGIIYDLYNNPIALNRPDFQLNIFREKEDLINKYISSLSNVVEFSEKDLERIFKDNKFGYEEDERYSEDDPHHLSVKGHIKFANLINKWIGPR